MFWLICVVLMLCSNVGTTKMPSSVASKCKEHIIRNQGYKYETFYKMQKISDKEFEMHIGVMASDNGHILLSPKMSPNFTDPVYEIVIGCCNSNITQIRRNMKSTPETYKTTENILSPMEIRAFYIRMKNGTLDVGTENELPILTYHDENPLTINYFSFTTWYDGDNATFLYDCPAPSNTSKELTSTTNSEMDENITTNSESSNYYPESNSTARLEKNLTNTESLDKSELVTTTETVNTANTVSLKKASITPDSEIKFEISIMAILRNVKFAGECHAEVPKQ